MLIVPMNVTAFPRPDRWFDDHVYHHHSDLTTELTQLQMDHPHFVDLTSIGTSVQGREIWTVRITDPSIPAEGKKKIYIDGEHHGNEYLGGELCILLIHHLLENQDDPMVQQVLEEYIIWVTPMLNPDGNARDTRSNVNGVDLNRHYPFEFTPGGSHGDAPAVEPEVAANVAFMESVELDLYITMHTGIVRMIHPWGYTTDPCPDQSMYENLTEISEKHGIVYGQSSVVLYVAKGSAKDFGYGARGVPSFTYEVDDSQNRQISRREDIASRLSDELALLMDFILATEIMTADLVEQGLEYKATEDGTDVRVTLHNPTLSPANNTTVYVEVYQAGSLVTMASTMFDVPKGDTVNATVHVELEDGSYTLRTIVEYTTLLVENATIERKILRTDDVTVDSSFLASSGGLGIGLFLLLIAAGVAFLFWAYQKDLWRPGMVWNRIMSRVRPSQDA
jgi:predicted deacylase